MLIAIGTAAGIATILGLAVLVSPTTNLALPKREDRFVPVLSNCGQPANVDPQRYMIVTRFEPDQKQVDGRGGFNIDGPERREGIQAGNRF